ncbi:MAG: hypothetical protein ABSG67_09145 [Thermoguttaceae bacterium]|jgi:hypothetical protein
MLSDTHPDAEKVQVELMRQASVADRVAIMRSLTNLSIRMSRQAIAEAHPEFNPREVALYWVELHYGKQLADELREYIKCNPTRFPEKDFPRCDPL